MASDPATVNAMKAQTKALEDLNRSVKAQTQELKKIGTAINHLNTNIVEALAALRPKEDIQDASGL